MDNGTTTSTETYTDEEIDKAFEEAFGSDGIVFGEDDEGDGTATDETVTAGTTTGAEDTDGEKGADEDSAPEDATPATATEDKPEDKPAPAEKPVEDTHEVDNLRAELEKAREELAMARRREKDIAEHLKGDGYESVDAELAERMGLSLEDYQKHLSEESDAELAEKYRKLRAEQEEQKKRSATDELFRRDEQAILEYDPQMKGRFAKLEEAPFFKDFAILRSMGKDVIEAYRMANYAELSKREAKAHEAQAPAADNRGHMTSSATKQTGSEVSSIPADEIAVARELFPDLSDAEIDKLYKRIK